MINTIYYFSSGLNKDMKIGSTLTYAGSSPLCEDYTPTYAGSSPLCEDYTPTYAGSSLDWDVHCSLWQHPGFKELNVPILVAGYLRST